MRLFDKARERMDKWLDTKSMCQWTDPIYEGRCMHMRGHKGPCVTATYEPGEEYATPHYWYGAYYTESKR